MVAKIKKPSTLRLGVILVAASYLLMVPTFVFLALAAAGQSPLWRTLAPATYALSWIVFIAGLLLAGVDAVRTSRRWVVGVLKGQPVWRLPPPKA